MSDATEPITVVYIGGAGRSGSTLLERLICERAGYFAVGELRYLWQRGYERDELCSCGEQFSHCPFWRAVLDDALDSTDLRELDDLRASLDDLVRIRRVAQYRLPALRDDGFQQRLTRLGLVYARLFRAVQERSGARVIVDSSKSGPYGYFLASNPSLDVRVLHLVRDSRAVAYSWQRQKRRPEAGHDDTSDATYMPTFPPSRAAQIWWEHNLLIGSLRNRLPHSALLRYEDFTASTDRVSDALRQLGLEAPPLIDGPEAQRHRHSVSGNPSRLEKAPARVREDAEWLSRMDRRSLQVVTSLTAPGLVRYGYPLSPRGVRAQSRDRT